MGVLITTIVTGALAVFGVISEDVFLSIVGASLLWAILAAITYFKLGWFKFFYHDILGWHVPDESPRYFDGCSDRSICKHCGKDIMQDSQGNWF